MARDKPVDTQPTFVAIDLAAQLLPGTFEHALYHLLEQAILLTPFDARYRNDQTSAPVYAPAMLLRVVLFAYSRGIVSNRAIARARNEQVTFIALSGDSRPHGTTIARFVGTLGDEIAPIFAAVLAVCDRQALVGRERCAIDGVKRPSKALKHRSGTRADVARHAEKREHAADAMLARHRAEDARPLEPTWPTKDRARVERSQADAAELRTSLPNVRLRRIPRYRQPTGQTTRAVLPATKTVTSQVGVQGPAAPVDEMASNEHAAREPSPSRAEWSQQSRRDRLATGREASALPIHRQPEASVLYNKNWISQPTCNSLRGNTAASGGFGGETWPLSRANTSRRRASTGRGYALHVAPVGR
jgi:transposase